MNMGQRFVILGGAGFIGSNLLCRLIELGRSVCIADRPLRLSQVALLRERQDLSTIAVSDLSRRSLLPVLEPNDVVYHLWSETGPQSSTVSVASDISRNLVPSVELFDLCVEIGIKRMIFASSGAVYGATIMRRPFNETDPVEPMSSYGIVKLATEKYLALYQRLFGLDYVVLRIGNAYGPYLRLDGRQNVIGSFVASIHQAKPLKLWGDGSATKDYIYVADVVKALVCAADMTSNERRIFNIGTGVGTSVSTLIRLLSDIVGHALPVEHGGARDVDPAYMVLDPFNANNEMDWAASTRIEDGLKTTLEWAKTSMDELQRPVWQ